MTTAKHHIVIVGGCSAGMSVVLGVGLDHGVGIPTELQELFVE